MLDELLGTAGKRMNSTEFRQCELQPDHTGNLERQLVFGRQAIDPAGDQTLHRFGDIDLLQGIGQITHTGGNPTSRGVTHNQITGAQRVKQFETKERIPGGTRKNERKHRFIDPGGAGPACQECVQRLRIQSVQSQIGRTRAIDQPLIGLRRRSHRPYCQHDQHRQRLVAQCLHQRPGACIEPLRILKYQNKRLLRNGMRHEPDQALTHRVDPNLAGRSCAFDRIAALPYRERLKQRCQIFRQHIAQAQTGINQIGHDQTPGIIRHWGDRAG
jgi:hypothetical protein